MTDNRTTKLREKLNKLIIELDRLDTALDSPASDMTLGEYEREREELLDRFVQTMAATLGSGTLTAEQVRETVEKHWRDLPDEYDMPEATALPKYSYDWQAIADELNTEEHGCVKERTCKTIPVESGWDYVAGCSNCGEYFPWPMLKNPVSYCPNCGAKVTEHD